MLFVVVVCCGLLFVVVSCLLLVVVVAVRALLLYWFIFVDVWCYCRMLLILGYLTLCVVVLVVDDARGCCCGLSFAVG